MTTRALAAASAGPGFGGLGGWAVAALVVALLAAIAWWASRRRRR